MVQSTLVAIAGLGGAVGSTLAAGLCMPPEEIRSFGMAMESPLVRALGRPLLPVESILLDGWDLRRHDLLTACRQHKICSRQVLARAKRQLKAITPRMGVDGRTRNIGAWIRQEAAYLDSRRRQENAEHLILVNLCPTEPLPSFEATNCDWRDLDRIDRIGTFPTSMIYFRLAIEARAHFINFTPNPAEAAPLRELAEKAGVIYAGRDGKTGQTFIKTILAPAFRDRNLYLDGWFSTNLLGNEDGLSLARPEAGKSKIASKSKCLASILGYAPGGEGSVGHQVHIHYYPPRGDSKEAWDNIDFRGFLGTSMQMKINWLGQDSILAAPAVIDLIRLVAFAAETGFRGPLEAASYFFKDPVVGAGSIVQHSVPAQFETLLGFLRGQEGA